MDGEVQPKFGLMASLVLMNVAAIALFFFATPTRETKNQSLKIESNNSENVQTVGARVVEKIMAGDAVNSVVYEDDKEIAVLELVDAKVEEGFTLQTKISEGMDGSLLPVANDQILSPGHQAEIQTLPGKIEINVISYSPNAEKAMSELGESSDILAEPPLAIALKNFLGETSSGVRTFFDGLKNGYTKKRTRENISSNSNLKKTAVRGSSSLSKMQKVKRAPGTKTKEPSPLPCETHMSLEPTPISMWGPLDSTSNQEIISTEIVMDILSKTQKRTNELIQVFSENVIPAIERMNERVADAIRLEKNLDSYTSALIGAINSVVCSNSDISTHVKQKKLKSGTTVVRKLKNTKAFLSDLSLMRDSRIHDYVGSFSKGEQSSINKRPVFKTWAAHCWHTRKAKKSKNKKTSRRYEELLIEEVDEVRMGQQTRGPMDQRQETCEYDVEEISNYETLSNLKSGCSIPTTAAPVIEKIVEGELKLIEPTHQRTIGIEEVLTLTSTLDQIIDQEVKSDSDVQPFLSPLNSNISLSSGTVFRTLVIEPTKLMLNQAESECKAWESEAVAHDSSPLSSSLLQEAPTQYGTKHSSALDSGLSVVCDSRVQDYDSYIAQQESSSAAACLHEETGTRVMQYSETTPIVKHPGELRDSISISGEMKNTRELINVFRELDLQQKEVALENVCLLVLKIFEAWSESQQSISPVGLSTIPLSSTHSQAIHQSADEASSQVKQQFAAICSSKIDSALEQKSDVDNIPKKSELGELGTDVTNHTGICCAEIPENLLQNVVTAADILNANESSDTVSRDLLQNIVAAVDILDADESSKEISQDLMQSVVAAAEIQIAERSLMELKTNSLRNRPLNVDALEVCSLPTDPVNQSGFGDISERVVSDEDIAVSLVSKSQVSVKASKESSSATFYTSQPELSEEVFYECSSTMSAGTCGSAELELEDSSKVFLEKIQEEGTTIHKNEDRASAKIIASDPQTAGIHTASSIQSWLSDSAEALRTAADSLNLEDLPASDNYDVACGTDDEACPCSSMDLSGDESKTDNKLKKKKWGAKFFKKFLVKKKPKPSSLTSLPLSKNISRSSHSDSVLKQNNHNGAATE